mgnify:CR=1 FL=1
MQKALSLILAVIMLMSTMAVCAFAYIDNGGVCRCLDHTDTKPCKCCLYCSSTKRKKCAYFAPTYTTR